MDRLPTGERRLLDFCFSCRILGLHVEQWVYRLLGQPVLKVVGEVISEVADTSYGIDWIESYSANANAGEPATECRNALPPVYARGGCNLAAVTHYFSLSTPDVVAEWNFLRSGIAIRSDHSLMLRYAIEGLPNGVLPVIEVLGYRPEDFETRVFGCHSPKGVARILSFWADAEVPLYRHRKLDLVIPFWLVGAQQHDLTTWTSEKLDSSIRRPEMRVALDALRSNFEYVGLQDESGLVRNMTVILNSVPEGDVTYILLPNEVGDGGMIHSGNARLRRWIQAATTRYKDVSLIDVARFVRGAHERHDINHFHRMVYFRLYESIRDHIVSLAGNRAVA